MSEHIVKAPNVPPFVTFVTSAVPMVFDNSLSYYEALCALWKWLQDDVVNVINNNATVTEEYINLTNELKTFVEDYFDNLDVQEEINNKLDEMAEDGTLQELINNYLQPNVAWTFDNVSDMKLSTKLVDGTYAETLGYYSVGDGGGAKYKIKTKTTETPNEMDIISISDTIIAELVTDSKRICVKQFGAKANGTDNDALIIQYAIDYAVDNNLSEVFLHSGNYLVTSPIILKDYISFIGENREKTKIIKQGHTTDSVYSTDCVLTATYRSDSSLTYPRHIEIREIGLNCSDHNDQPQYGFYIRTGAFFTINNFTAHYCGCNIYLGDMWLSTVKSVATGYGTIGFRTLGGTTLDINDVYTAENTQYGYYLQGLSYSQISNLACDSSPSAIPYYVYYSNIDLNAIGCEAENYTTCMYIMNSMVNVSNSNLRVNMQSATSTVLKLQASNLTLTNTIIGYETQTGSAKGKFLDVVGNGSHLTINNLTVYPSGFEVSNSGNANNDITLVDKNNITTVQLIDRGFVGSNYNYASKTLVEKLNIPTLHSQLSEPCCHITNNNYKNTSIAWELDRRPIGAIIPNVALNKSGAVMFIKKNDTETCYITEPISSTTLSGSTLLLNFESITLDSLAIAKGTEITTNWRLRLKDSSNTPVVINSIDLANHVITVNTTSGFATGDYVELIPPRDVRDCTFLPVQGVLMGTTGQRPSEPKNGTMYYDTSLNKPIWWVTNHWKDATGTNV